MSIKSFIFQTMIRIFGAKGFTKMYLATSKSKTYSKFCEKVYGRDLCQANMLDEEQLQFLISNLKLNLGQNVLDLGCGIGKIYEYISDATGAKVHGFRLKNADGKLDEIKTQRNIDSVIEGILNWVNLKFFIS